MNLHKLWRMLVIAVMDALLLGAAAGLAILVRFDFALSQVPPEYLDKMGYCLLIQIVVTIAVFA